MPTALEHAAAEFMAGRHRLLAFVLGLVRDPHLAEDVFQEVWLKLAGELQRGTVIHDPGKWSRQTAKHIILRHWRDRRNAKVEANSDLLEFIEHLERAFEEEPAPSDDWLARRRALADCVRTLPERSRRLLHLRYDEGATVEAIAGRLGQSFDAVTKALYRLRRTLADCVERRLRREEAMT
jgi:RNA polymerase sigma-70 factor (ECF subfamily)